MTDSIHKSSARDFFLYFLVIITLYICVWRFIDLWFDVINFYFPDPLYELQHYYFSDASYTIRWSISSLIIVFPVYAGLSWFLRKDILRSPEKKELRVRKWLLYFTLFLAAVTVITDLVTLLNKFLEGEISARFVLKVIVVLFTAAAVFAYYFWELRRESPPSKWLVAFVSLIILAAMVMGFVVMGSPNKQRKLKTDNERVQHLVNMQSEIVNYWSTKEKLPEHLDQLNDNISGFRVPDDPDTGEAYEYIVKEPLAFRLCANFSLESYKTSPNYPPRYIGGDYPYGDNWNHASGRFCFDRTIDPLKYGRPKPVKD